jgi:hypothetical protein
MDPRVFCKVNANVQTDEDDLVMLTIATQSRRQPMTKWAGMRDMYMLIRSDYRYYLGIYYLATYPVLHG